MDNCVCPGLTDIIYMLAGLLSFIILLSTLVGVMCCRRYQSFRRTIRELQKRKNRLVSTSVQALEEEVEELPPQIPLRQNIKIKPLSRRLCKGLQQVPSLTKSDLNLLQRIKSGKDGVVYKARMNKGMWKGHCIFTCKISKEGIRSKYVDKEVSIMRKLIHHKNILQLLDWNTTEEPYLLLMEYVSYGTLRTFLQTNSSQLNANPELQSLLTITSYHIALAMQHLHSKMIVHCDLALKNIMVSKFPWEVKVAEFGMARDLTRMTKYCSSRWRNPWQSVPLRWYPPEYFKNNYYSFKGDIWAFGIVLWEIQMFGMLPYPNLETSKSVVHHICAGHKNTNPEGCRQEILHIMHDCWQEPHTRRPSFTDIVQILEDVTENDADYVDVESPQTLENSEAEHHDSTVSIVLNDQNHT